MVQRSGMRRAAALLSTFFALALAASLAAAASPADEDGYRLWLRYEPLPAARRERVQASGIVSLAPDSPTVQAARAELQRGVAGLLGRDVNMETAPRTGSIVLARARDLDASADAGMA